MRYTISTAPVAPPFQAVTLNVTADTPADLILLTNLFGGVPAEGTTTEIDALAATLRTTSESLGISKSTRKAGVGFNWGKKLRECLASRDEN